MTEKKQKILDTALNLFATDGFGATSTNKIAKTARVSEGLIFRHFKNKDSLLAAIMEAGDAKIQKHIDDIAAQADAKTIIRKVIELPFLVTNSEDPYWTLYFTLQHEGIEKVNKLWEGVHPNLVHALTLEGYYQPAMEAQFLELAFNGITEAILSADLRNVAELEAYVKARYYV